MPQTSDFVADATRHAERFSERLIGLLSFVPDEKLAWSPSPTSASALRLVAHGALCNEFFARIIGGEVPPNMATPADFFREIKEGEAKIETREEAVARLRTATAELTQAMSRVDAASLAATPDSPFGPAPMRFWLQEAGTHLATHAGQLAYLQTIWGDLDDHMG